MTAHYYISTVWATFMITVTGGVITEAAPIARWMIGKPVVDIKPWLKRKGAVVKVME